MSTNKMLTEIVTAALKTARQQMHTHLPAVVTAVNKSGSRIVSVDCQPLIKATHLDEDGEAVVERLPVVSRVPILQPGAGGMRVTFPVKVGDTVLLAFSEASLDNWLAHGGEVEPTDGHRHHLSDAVAILGLRDYAHSLVSSPDDRMTLGADAGIQVHVTENEILLGGAAATDTLALKGDLDTLKSAINGAATVAGDGGAAFKAAILLALAAWPVLHTGVKSKP